MPDRRSSSSFTKSADARVGPPMIGALMRLPWEAVVQRLLRALHENGFDDIEGPQLAVLLWPGPEGMRPSERAHRPRPRARPGDPRRSRADRARMGRRTRTGPFRAAPGTPRRTQRRRGARDDRPDLNRSVTIHVARTETT